MRWSSVKEMSEEALLNSHFETGEEMRRRNMAGAEIWITGHGLVAAGNEDAKKILLDIYNDDNSIAACRRSWSSAPYKLHRLLLLGINKDQAHDSK